MTDQKSINHFGVSGGKDSTAALLWAVHESGYDPATIRATMTDTNYILVRYNKNVTIPGIITLWNKHINTALTASRQSRWKSFQSAAKRRVPYIPTVALAQLSETGTIASSNRRMANRLTPLAIIAKCEWSPCSITATAIRSASAAENGDTNSFHWITSKATGESTEPKCQKTKRSYPAGLSKTIIRRGSAFCATTATWLSGHLAIAPMN